MFWVCVMQHIAYEPLGLGRSRLHPSEQLEQQGVAGVAGCCARQQLQPHPVLLNVQGGQQRRKAVRMARSYVSAVTEAAQEAMAQERTTRGDGWPARSKLAKTRSASSKGADEWCVAVRL